MAKKKSTKKAAAAKKTSSKKVASKKTASKKKASAGEPAVRKKATGSKKAGARKAVAKTVALPDPPDAPDAIGPLTPELVAEFTELVSHYPVRRSALIPALHRCQEELGGWLSPEILEACATFFELEPVEVYGVASFYPMFHLRPVGTHVVSVCHNLSCNLRGAEDILDEACRVTGCARPGTVSPDGKFTVLRVECQGTCTNAPMLDLDGVYHENLDVADVAKLLGGVS